MATSESKSVKVTNWDTLKFSWWEESQSVDKNTTTIGWKMELISGSYGRIDSSASKSWSVTVNGTKYSGTNKVGISNNATKTLASGTTTIAHNSDGSKTFSYSFSQQFSITFSDVYIGTKSGSGTGTLDDIPRLSSLSVANGTLGNALTLTVTRESTSFTHSIKAVCGSSTLYIKADGSTSSSEVKHNDLSLPFTPPLSWASQNITGETVSVAYTITTYNGNTSLGSKSYTKTCAIPSSVKPSFTVTPSDAEGYSETFGGLVQTKSKLKVEIAASGSYGSTIKSYRSTFAGKTYTTATFTTDAISKTGTLPVSVIVTDSRGRTATQTVDVLLLPYSLPQISSLKCFRADADGNADSTGGFLAVKFDSNITPLNNKNAAKYQLEYKKTTADKYETEPMDDFTGQYSVSGGVFVFSADKSSSYDIIMTVEDSFADDKRAGYGASIKKTFSILKGIFGFAIGKIAELPNVFDIALQTRFMGGILHPILEPETDLNEVKTPNTYVGANVGTHNYGNLPLELNSGTFALEVRGAGEEGQIHQILAVCSKTNPLKYERFFYQEAWGKWFCTSNYGGTLLANPDLFMQYGQTVTLSQKISEQRNGIVLVFDLYDSENKTASSNQFQSFFVPKMVVALHDGKTHNFQMNTHGYTKVCTKLLYIFDDKIEGFASNNKTGTENGVTFDNTAYILRYVIGV